MNLTTPLIPGLVLQGVPESYQPLAEDLSVVLEEAVAADVMTLPPERSPDLQLPVVEETDQMPEGMAAHCLLVTGVGRQDDRLDKALAHEQLADLAARRGNVTWASTSYRRASMSWFLYWSDPRRNRGSHVGSNPARDFSMLRHWFYDLAHGGEVGFFNPLAIHLRNLAAQGHPLAGTASEEHFAASSEVAAEAAFLSAMAYLLYAWVSFRDKGGRPIVEALSEASAMFYMAGTLYRVRSRMPEAKDHLGDDARYRASQVLEDSVQNLIGSRRL